MLKQIIAQKFYFLEGVIVICSNTKLERCYDLGLVPLTMEAPLSEVNPSAVIQAETLFVKYAFSILMATNDTL